MNKRKCPFCNAEIPIEAQKCQHCGEWLNDEHTPGDSTIISAFSKDYEIIEEIGRGGMSTVYKARYKRLDRTVALKIIPRALGHDKEYIDRLYQEAKYSANLNHPNLITVYDVGEMGSYPYISMEYLSGNTLADLVKKKGSLSERKIRKIMLSILEGLQYSHSKGVIHRDIKSSNIMFDQNGRPVLMDFGIALNKKGTRLTQDGSILGTPEFMSPEQADSDIEVDHRTDIYSLGIVMYEMATGSLPFLNDNPLAVINEVLHKLPPRPKDSDESISDFLSNVILKAINKDPEKRYSSCSEFAQILSKNKRYSFSSKEVEYRKKSRASKKKKRKKISRKTVNKFTYGIGILLIFVVAFLVYNHLYPYLQVPAVMGKKYEKAVDALQKKGFKPVVQKWHKTDDKQKYGLVYNQTPYNGEKRKGGKIFLQVYKQYVKVPNIKNVAQKKALNILKKQGLHVKTVEYKYDPNVKKGRAVAVKENETELPKGSALNLIISKGIQMEKLPDFKDFALAKAKFRLKELGFVMGNIKHEYSNHAKRDIVLKTEPVPGKIPRGSKIDFYVSVGKTEVPKLVNLSKNAALSKLKKAGLQVGEITYTKSNIDQGGLVLSAHPAKGKILLGSTVDLVVSYSMTTIPDVIGLDFAKARRKLEKASLIVLKGKGIKTYRKKDNLVESHSLQDKDRVRTGSEIELNYYERYVKTSNIKAMSKKNAIKKLKNKSLIIENVKSVWNKNVPIDQVIGIEGNAEEVRSGTRVNLLISKGEKKFVSVGGGYFNMGNSGNGAEKDELPVHRVYIDDFNIWKHEITNAEIASVFNWALANKKAKYKNGKLFSTKNDYRYLIDIDDPDCKISYSVNRLQSNNNFKENPCVQISHFGAMAFCNFLSEMQGYDKCYKLSRPDYCNWFADGYRLPTEAEWEYAARGGKAGENNSNNLINKYAGSNTISRVAWYSSNARQAQKVCTKQPNELQICDMSGNVWEWCWDYYDANYYNDSFSKNPKGPSQGNSYVIRGGAWDSGRSECTVFERNQNKDIGDNNIGFRIVKKL